jgi:hypothetical protein
LIPELGVPFSTTLWPESISAFQVSKDDGGEAPGACPVGKGVSRLKRSRQASSHYSEYEQQPSARKVGCMNSEGPTNVVMLDSGKIEFIDNTGV